jgi:hypothetical protein
LSRMSGMTTTGMKLKKNPPSMGACYHPRAAAVRPAYEMLFAEPS